MILSEEDELSVISSEQDTLQKLHFDKQVCNIMHNVYLNNAVLKSVLHNLKATIELLLIYT